MTAPDQDLNSGQQSPPVCFRHPGRETWVSCVRCGRPACPDCLRDASVGQQCVECVRGASRGTRSARTAFGGKPTAGTPVTWAIMAVNIVVFIAEIVHPKLMYDLSMLAYGGYAPGGLQAGVAQGAWYRLLTSAFTAPGTTVTGAGLIDLALNMWCLYIIGPQLERLFGAARYLGIYLLSAIGGSVLYYFMEPGLAAGASGAIFGLFAAYFIATRRLGVNSSGIITLIVINLVFSFVVANIAWQDHIGGLITGAVMSAAYAYAPRKNRTVIQVAATIVVIALLAVAVMIRTSQLT